MKKRVLLCLTVFAFFAAFSSPAQNFDDDMMDEGDAGDFEYAEPGDFRPVRRRRAVEDKGTAGGEGSKVIPKQRIVDIGLFDLNVTAGQNLFPLGDVFKETFVIDFDKMLKRIPEDKFPAISMDLDMRFLEINYNHPSKGWGIGISPGVKARTDIALPRSLIAFLADGNGGANANIVDHISLSASVFFEVGLRGYFPIMIAGKPLRISLSPTYFSPVLYVPKSNIGVILDTRGPSKAAIKGDFPLYTGSDIFGGNIAVGSILAQGGGDLSIGAEYPLFDILFGGILSIDVGAAISNIPLVPAKMDKGVKGAVDVSIKVPENASDLVKGDGFDSNIDFKTDSYGPLPTLYVVRPTRFDFFARYRPFKNDMLALVPNIGFTLGNNAVDAKDMDIYFNGSLEIQTRWGKFIPGYLFTAYFNTGILEGFWHNRLGLILNLRAFELDIEIGTTSTDYIGAWDGSGISVGVGMRFGW